ncbi:MAG: glycosyltransferase family 2 protein [Flavobacteriaceae bacterium]|jgi:glycosyltransferase involved in cell wall biosynthesis|nr:glycosyltransferase family 2 protein [Flavobacteriaceae bacterium]
MKVSLIITTYNRPDALLIVLKSIEAQILKPFEVIIADDGSSNRTFEVLEIYKKKSNLTILHSWQEDFGFRAAKSRNKAISLSSGEYIVLIDGDMILHPKFISDHIYFAKFGFFTQGSRVLLTHDKTKMVLNKNNTQLSFISNGIKKRRNAIHSDLLAKLFLVNNISLRGIKSCNMGFFRKDCDAVNGFNNDFEGWGREDSEFAVRLINSGIIRQNLRFNAIQFHLWHMESERIFLQENNLLLQDAIDSNRKWCKNGINSL